MGFETKYHLDSWVQATEYSPDSCLYKNPQEWEDEKRESELCRAIYKCFEYGRNNGKVPLEALESIMRIIEANHG